MPPVIAAGLGYIALKGATAVLATTVLTTAVAAVAASAIAGAISGAAYAAMTDGDVGEGALKGAVIGGIAGGISNAAKSAASAEGGAATASEPSAGASGGGSVDSAGYSATQQPPPQGGDPTLLEATADSGMTERLDTGAMAGNTERAAILKDASTPKGGGLMEGTKTSWNNLGEESKANILEMTGKAIQGWSEWDAKKREQENLRKLQKAKFDHQDSQVKTEATGWTSTPSPKFSDAPHWMTSRFDEQQPQAGRFDQVGSRFS